MCLYVPNDDKSQLSDVLMSDIVHIIYIQYTLLLRQSIIDNVNYLQWQRTLVRYQKGCQRGKIRTVYYFCSQMLILVKIV